MSKRVNVLDSGFVEYIDHMGSDLTVVNSARVSFDKASTFDKGGELSEKDYRLIKYLAEHNHWTPFAHPQITLRIKAPVSIRTQLFKHKVGFTENEVSRRYVSYTPDVYQPYWRGKPTGGAKQGSEDFIEEGNLKKNCTDKYKAITDACMEAYEEMISKGIAPEQARFILPQGAYTEWYWTGSLSGFARVYKQRIDPHAQWEVREYAKAISEIIEPLFPESWYVLTTNT